MIKAKGAAILAASLYFGSLGAGDGTKSNRMFVQLQPVQNSFWHTATNATMALPIIYPEGATSASLSVRGIGYAHDYTNITGDEFVLNLPPADSPKDENVYHLTLSFDNGVVQTATLGLVRGYAAGARGATRCLLSNRSGEWKKVVRRAVLPVPYGITSLTLNGETVETGLEGDQGWYAIGKANGGESYNLMMSVDDIDYTASLLGFALGARFILR